MGSHGMGKKEYCPFPALDGSAGGGLTVLGAAITAFAEIPQVKIIIIAVPDNPKTGEAAARNALPQGLFAGKSSPAVLFVSGGKTRRASVFNALSLLSARDFSGYVLIHDGARPWISPSLIRRLITAVKKYNAVIPFLPVTETPKEIDRPLGEPRSGPVFIRQHLKRALVGSAQTPQCFAFPEILRAHEKAAKQEKLKRREFTDDAEVWAAFCGPVAAIPGELQNRKITFPEDLK